MVLSWPPETINLLSILMETLFTPYLWPLIFWSYYPLSRSQTLTVLSLLPEAIYLLSELIAILITESL
jgi:hypothetical protein